MQRILAVNKGLSHLQEGDIIVTEDKTSRNAIIKDSMRYSALFKLQHRFCLSYGAHEPSLAEPDMMPGRQG